MERRQLLFFCDLYCRPSVWPRMTRSPGCCAENLGNLLHHKHEFWCRLSRRHREHAEAESSVRLISTPSPSAVTSTDGFLSSRQSRQCLLDFMLQRFDLGIDGLGDRCLLTPRRLFGEPPASAWQGLQAPQEMQGAGGDVGQAPSLAAPGGDTTPSVQRFRHRRLLSGGSSARIE